MAVEAVGGAEPESVEADFDTNGINAINANSLETNAPLFNLAGQKVTKSYKGVVIQNGRKMVLK